MPTEDDEKPKPGQVDYDVAMRRVVYLVCIGCVVAVMYAFRFICINGQGFFETTTVGLMVAGASLLSGGLIGFLFGVPHTREEGSNLANEPISQSENEQDSKPKQKKARTSYPANTSLEQISDWLSKMLVGVGLVEIKVIPGKLKEVAAYAANGLGNDDAAKAFAMAEILYFSVCGFVFGFLWARLYLARWFALVDAQQIQELGEKIDRFTAQQQADARALAVINQLNRQTNDPALTEAEVAERIKAASVPVKIQIFAQAQDASDRGTDNHDSVIAIFKGLIKSDSAHIYHRNYSELSYAFRRQLPPNWEAAEEAITQAIEIRDKLQKTGWKYYEYHRARCRIEQDQNFKKKAASDEAFVKQIMPDLHAAYEDKEKWPKWYRPNSSVRKWMELNGIDPNAIGHSSN